MRRAKDTYVSFSISIYIHVAFRLPDLRPAFLRLAGMPAFLKSARDGGAWHPACTAFRRRRGLAGRKQRVLVILVAVAASREETDGHDLPPIAIREDYMALGGLVITFTGFLLAAASLGITSSTMGRLAIVLVGIAISLVGIMGPINKAYQKDAVWKR
jgi:hypothetical protein